MRAIPVADRRRPVPAMVRVAEAPGDGPSLLSLYCWAAHPDNIQRLLLLDQQSVSSLIQHGWLENPSVPVTV
ncbi:hypothetical protein LQL77_31765 [Rhodococcus cerastii]|nr:hypothetical protein [Rhodococcus cerastii]